MEKKTRMKRMIWNRRQRNREEMIRKKEEEREREKGDGN